MPIEHDRIEPLLDAVTAGFAAITPAVDAARRDELVAAVGRAEQAILAHLAHEETAALPLMQRHLAEERWRAAQKAAAKEYGSPTCASPSPGARGRIGDDQFGVAFAHGGVLIRVLLALTRRPFEREHQVAFRSIASADEG